LAYRCPQSIRGTELPIADWWGEAALIGRAVHDACQIMVNTGSIEEPQQAAVALRHSLAEQARRDYRICVACARDFWRQYAGHFPQPRTEEQITVEEDGLRWTGHPDVLSVGNWGGEPNGRIVRILDWKSTWLEDADYRAQMMRYLWLACRTIPANRYQSIVAYLRDKTAETSPEYTRDDLEAYHRDFVERVLKAENPAFGPGQHCTFCPRLPTCPAHTAIVRRVVADLDAPDTRAASFPLAPAQIVKLHERVKMLEGLCERFHLYAKGAAIQAGGRLIGGEGRDLAIITMPRDEIDALKAWPLLTQRLTVGELAAAVTIGKGKVLEAIVAKAPRGAKKRAGEAFMKELDAAGAVTTKETQQLRIVRSLPDQTRTGEIEEGAEDGENTDSAGGGATGTAPATG
jgi:hypothetical protein